MKSFIVLNPTESTYEVVRAESIEALSRELGLLDVEVNGTYISCNCPTRQVIAVADSTVFDLRK